MFRVFAHLAQEDGSKNFFRFFLIFREPLALFWSVLYTLLCFLKQTLETEGKNAMQNEKNTSPIAFGLRLRECRGIQRTGDLAERVGKTAQTWNGWERGRSEPEFATLVKLCQLFDVSADFLLGVSPDRKPPTLSAITKGANSPALATSGGSATVCADSALVAHLQKQVEDLTAEKNRLLGIIEVFAKGSNP